MDVSALIGRNWSDLRRAAQQYALSDEPGMYERAGEWYQHGSHEVRFFAVSVLGRLSAKDERALAFLFERCGEDPAWQVNEGLAMAFDDFCAAIGYEAAIPMIRTWLGASRPNLRRAVSEGLRPWTAAKRVYFARNPELAIELLGTLRDDPSRYVQESVGNALRDISRKHPELVLAALRRWIDEKPDARPRRIIAKFALKRAVKEDPSLIKIYG